jgi:hypothetical protein
VTSRPFHYLLVLAVAIWAHVCCCSAGPGLAGERQEVATKTGAAVKACCRHHDQSTPTKSPCKPGSCGRCVEKNLTTSGQGALHLAGWAIAAFDIPSMPPLPLLSQALLTPPAIPAAYPPTSLLRLHCALIV